MLFTFRAVAIALWPSLCYSNINFLIVILGESPLYGYFALMPYFDASFQICKKLYPKTFANVTMHSVFEPNLPACGDTTAAMPAITGKIYQMLDRFSGYRNTDLLVLTVDGRLGCNLEVVPLGDLARERNVPVISRYLCVFVYMAVLTLWSCSTIWDPTFANRQRFPTFLSFSSRGTGGHVPATKAMMRQFNWRTVTIFCDTLSKNAAVATFISSHCQHFPKYLTTKEKFQVYFERYDSTFDGDYRSKLLRAQSQSRVIILLTRADEVRKIMMVASQLDMISSEYVYIFTLTLQGFGHLPLLVDIDDTNDNVVFEAYKRLVVLTFEIPDYQALSGLIDAAADIANKTYKHPFTKEDKYSELTLTIPEMIFSVAKALNDSPVPLDQLTSEQFHDDVVNREFPSNIRRVIIASNGMRLANTIFLRLNITSRKFEPAWLYDAPTQNFSKTSALADQWFDPSGPPPNQPICGFRHDRCGLNIDLTPVLVGSICGGILGILSIVAGSIAFINWIAVHNEGEWWRLSDESLSPIAYTTTEQQEYPVLTTYFGDRVLVRTKEVESADPANELGEPVLKTLRQLRDMRHDNVGQFRGLILKSFQLSIVWEGGRGSLKTAFSNDAIMSEESIKVYFMYNVIMGLRHIHLNTGIEAHGSLSSSSVILDDRFTAKLCDVGSNTLISKLNKTTKLVTMIFISKPDDIYCLGKVILEILRGKATESGEDLFLDMFKLHNKMLLSVVREVLRLCFRENAQERPTIKTVYLKLERFRPKGSVVDNLLEGLQRHAENLEDIVGRRTVELLGERRRVDDLLAEIIPRPFIPRLREHRIPQAETFDSATICFSSMVGFDELCRSKLPVDVCVYLNELYSFIDQQIAGFDVYKVETIKDGYVVASGLPVRNENHHCFEIAAMSLHILQSDWSANSKTYLPIRIGLHTGPIAAGFVGVRMPRYCLFGDTMNTASRMESHGEGSRIHISSDAKDLLDTVSQFCIVSRGLISIKGKGLVDTYWLEAQRMVLS